MRYSHVPAIVVLFMFLPLSWAVGDEKPAYEHKEDVIYGRKSGMALTMDVFTPKARRNGAGVILIVSGGWQSSHDHIRILGEKFVGPFLGRGYTVFAVVHGSQPRYTVPECVAD